MSRRESAELIRQMREFLLGRKPIGHSRFQPDLAPRTQPPPQIPLGTASCKSANNYYFSRDPRQQVIRPNIIFDTSTKLKDAEKQDDTEINDGKEIPKVNPKSSLSPKINKLPTPGKVYKY